MSYLDPLINAASGAVNALQDTAATLMGLEGFAQNGLAVTNLGGQSYYKVMVLSKRRDGSSINVSAFLPEEFAFDTESEYNAPFEKGALSGSDWAGSIAQLTGYSLVTQFLTQQLWQGSSPITFSLPLEFVADYSADVEVIDKILDLSTLCMPSKEYGVLRSPGPVLRASKENLQDAQNGLMSAASTAFDVAGSGLKAGAAGAEAGFSQNSGFVDSLTGAAAGGAKGLMNDMLENGLPKVQNSLGKLSDEMSRLDRYDNVVQLHIGRFLLFPSVIVKSVRQTWTSQPDRNGRMMRAKADVTFSTHMTLTADDLRAVFMRPVMSKRG